MDVIYTLLGLLPYIACVALAVVLYPHLNSGPEINTKNWMQTYGKTAVITGAARGIGAEFAEQLAAMGMDLVLISRSSGTLDPTAQRIRDKYNVQVHTVVAELGRTVNGVDPVDLIIEEVKGRDIGLYVNNHAATNLAAEHSMRRYWVKEPLELHMQQIDINYTTSVRLLHHFARHFSDKGKGGMIIVSSQAGEAPTPFVTQYSSTKAGLTCLGRLLHYEMQDFNVDVHTMVVGATDTPAMRSASSAKARSMMGLQTTQEVVAEGLRGLYGKYPSRSPGLRNKVQSFVIGSLLPSSVSSSLQGKFIKENLRFSPE